MAKKPTKQTSDRVSRIAAKVLGRTRGMSRREWVCVHGPLALLAILRLEELRTLAASALSQDETPGKRKPKKRAKARKR